MSSSHVNCCFEADKDGGAHGGETRGVVVGAVEPTVVPMAMEPAVVDFGAVEPSGKTKS